MTATSRRAETRAALVSDRIQAVDPADVQALAACLGGSDALLVAAPPGPEGCPALAALAPVWPADATPWIGYLSTTGVYGDHDGGWVREDTPCAPASPEAERRVAAEGAWAAFAATRGAPFARFRLPGIYGPGRSALDRVRAGQARRWRKPGHVFSRIHVDDLADGLILAMQAKAGGVFNLCDDEPSPAADVTAYACKLLDVTPPPEEPLDIGALSPAARRFWAESKRVSNARAKAVLGWRPAYPSYREGLAAILRQEPGR